MLATVSQTRSLVGSYIYDRALNQREKGGQVIASNGIPQYSSAKTQLAYMKAYCSDKYEVKAINIVLSHSSKDKKLLEDNPDKKDKYVTDFLQECQARGIDLENTPWIITEHINTDCDHYHMILLTTKFDGTRLDTGFIGAKMSQSAWAASKKNGLHFAPGLDRRNEEWLKFVQDQLGEEKAMAVRSGEELSDEDIEKLKEASSKHRAETAKAKKDRRERSKAQLDEWKKKLKEVVEGVANYFIKKDLLMKDFVSLLKENGIFIGKDGKGRYNITAGHHGRNLTYKATRLGIDTSLFETIKGHKEMEEYLRKVDKLRKEEEAKADKNKIDETVEVQPKDQQTVKDNPSGEDMPMDVKTIIGLTEEELAEIKNVTSQNTATATRAKRAKSRAEANERKAKLKGIIEDTAGRCIKEHLSMKDFILLLEDSDIHFGKDDNDNYTVTANNGKKDVTHRVASLGVDLRLFDTIKRQEEEDERQRIAEQQRKEKEAKEEQKKARKAEETKKEQQQRVQTVQRENKPKWHPRR